MPRVRVEWLQGRTARQREEIAHLFTEAMVKVARVRPEQVTVVFEEVAPEFMFKASKQYQPVKSAE